MTAKNEEIRSLLSFFEKSTWEEMRLEVGGVKIAVSKTGSLANRGAAVQAAGPAPAAIAAAAVSAPAAAAVSLAPPAAAAAAAAAAAPASTGSALAAGQSYLRAPNLGVVWGQPKPGAPAFVTEGQLIEAGTTVCLIEVMKLFTQVASTRRARVVRCLVIDGEMVEYDSPLFIIEAV